MPRPGLSPEQNERVRAALRELLRQHDNNQSALAPKLGITQPGLSSFLSGRVGTTYFMVERVAKLAHTTEHELLGKQPPPKVKDARQAAAELAREIAVSERAIEDVLAEPLTPETQRWPTLWWADRMRRRDIELRQRELDVFGAAAAAVLGPPQQEQAPEPKPVRRRKTAR